MEQLQSGGEALDWGFPGEEKITARPSEGGNRTFQAEWNETFCW